MGTMAVGMHQLGPGQGQGLVQESLIVIPIGINIISNSFHSYPYF